MKSTKVSLQLASSLIFGLFVCLPSRCLAFAKLLIEIHYNFCCGRRGCVARNRDLRAPGQHFMFHARQSRFFLRFLRLSFGFLFFCLLEQHYYCIINYHYKMSVHVIILHPLGAHQRKFIFISRLTHFSHYIMQNSPLSLCSSLRQQFFSSSIRVIVIL